MTDYRTLALALHQLDAGHRAAVDAADDGYLGALAAAEGEVTNADAAARLAESTARAASQRIAEVDERSERLWLELAALLGRRGRRLGAVPHPSDEGVNIDPVARHAGRLDGATADPLDVAAETITRAALGEPIAPVPDGRFQHFRRPARSPRSRFRCRCARSWH